MVDERDLNPEHDESDALPTPDPVEAEAEELLVLDTDQGSAGEELVLEDQEEGAAAAGAGSSDDDPLIVDDEVLPRHAARKPARWRTLGLAAAALLVAGALVAFYLPRKKGDGPAVAKAPQPRPAPAPRKEPAPRPEPPPPPAPTPVEPEVARSEPAPEPTPEPEPVPAPATPPRPAESVTTVAEALSSMLSRAFARPGTAVALDEGGIEVTLRDNTTVTLAPGESLVELKNGNYFKGRIHHLSQQALTMAFAYGRIRIPMGELLQIVPRGSPDYLPLGSFPEAAIRLANGNRLTGRVLKETGDRVILGYPSARIVVSRSAIAEVQVLSAPDEDPTAAPPEPPAAPIAPVPVAARVDASLRLPRTLGEPYYDFDSGFSIVPPREWKGEVTTGFTVFEGTPLPGLTPGLAVAGLALPGGLTDAMLVDLGARLAERLKNFQVQDARAVTGAPWFFRLVGQTEVGGVPISAVAFFYRRAEKVFLVTATCPTRYLEPLLPLAESSARTLEYR